jgi:dCMP deaminase
MEKIIIAYVPVLHEGYYRLFDKYKNSILYVLGKDIISEFTYLSKEIRQLDPEIIKKSIESWGIMKSVEVLDKDKLGSLVNRGYEFVLPNEDIMHELSEKYLKAESVFFDQIFLRWDKHKIMEEKPVNADQKISRDTFDNEIMNKLKIESEKSSDWWRRVASAVIKDGEILLIAHNEHLPSPHSPYADGDPRNALHKGIGTDIATAIHSEAKLIAEAARRGVSLDGASLYVTIFPCSLCAKQIAFSGIKKIYYSGGYQMLDQETVLHSKGIEIIFVEP